MSTHYNHLCRLCAKKNDLSKDLLDKSNKNILDIIHQFIQISIKENDNLPTNICLDCEEKMVSFQLYILQCYKAQDYLNELCIENKLNIEDCQFEGDVIKSEVKNELVEDDIFIAIQSDSIAELGADDFQNDACDDMADSDNDDITTASLKERTFQNDACDDMAGSDNDDITTASLKERTFQNDACDDMAGSDNDDITTASLKERTFQNDACDDMAGSDNDDITTASLKERTFQNDACDDMAGSDNDDITIASLKERTFQNDACDDMAGSDNDDITIASLKERTSRQRQDVTEEAVAEFNRVLNKPNLDISDIVKLECTDCVMSFKSWDDICCHYAETHDTTPIVHCICGYTINSNSALTKHFTWHKKMNNEMRLLNKIDGDREALNFDDEGDYEDDVALTSLRPLKEENEVMEEETTHLNRIIENPSFKAKDIIKLQCRFCEKSFKSWSLLSSHYANIHKRRPRATCLCGYIIRSTSKFYGHVATHKKKAITNNSIAKIPKSKKCDKVLQAKMDLRVKDYIQLECTDCVMSFKSWDDICCHYAETHDTTPIVHCICGYTINSNSALTKHFTWHKKMNNEMRLLNKIDGDREALNFDDEGDYEDDVALTSLRPLKEENKVMEEETTHLNRIIENPSFKAKDIIKLQCRFCEKSFKSWSLLSSHYANIHKSRPRATCLCGYIIRSTFKFYSHVATHKKKAITNNSIAKIPKSKKCDKVLQAKMDLRVKDYIQFTCVYCDKECSSWTKLSSHTQGVHKLPAVVFCISCELALKSHSSIYKHVKDHNHPTELSCDQCSLRTKSLEALNKHKLKHVPKTEQKFECSKCDKVFSYKEGLKSHEKSHIPIEERKVYLCDKCELRFTSSSAMTLHMRIVHEKVKSYVCDNCGYACGTSGELRQHVAIHSDDRPFVCKICSKRFKTNTTLKSHEDTHGEKSYESFICNRVLSSRRTLRRHLLVHEDKGRYVHMFTHTGDKPLSCKWCDERFSYASTLRSHRLRCHPDKMAASHPTSSSSYQFSIVLKKPYAKDDPALVRVGTNES